MMFALPQIPGEKSFGGLFGGIISIGKSLGMIASLILVADMARSLTKSLRAGELVSTLGRNLPNILNRPEFWGEVQPPASLKGLDFSFSPSRLCPLETEQKAGVRNGKPDFSLRNQCCRRGCNSRRNPPTPCKRDLTTAGPLCSDGLRTGCRPFPWDEIIDAIDRVIGYAADNVGEPSLGIDVVEAGCFDQRGQGRPHGGRLRPSRRTGRLGKITTRHRRIIL
jgi:hypothetical protein